MYMVKFKKGDVELEVIGEIDHKDLVEIFTKGFSLLECDKPAVQASPSKKENK